VLVQERDTLTKTNKELTEHNADLLDTIKDLKKANRKSSGGASPSTSSATASESSDEKKVRRSSSRRPKESSARPEKEKERGRERDKERDKELRRKEKDRALLEETERLRKRFDSRGDESDAKSSNTSTKSQRNRRDSYIEPLGHGAPRPQAPVPPSPSPSRAYSSYPATSAPAYSTAPVYASIREPFAAPAPRALHPAVYVKADEYPASYGAGDEEDTASYHTHAHPRSTRHPR
jgi:hypothetical protein